MSNTQTVKAPELTPRAGQLACLQCVGARRQAEADGTEPLPPINTAITLAPTPGPWGVVATPTCYGHIAVAKTSPLIGGGAARVPADLVSGR